MNKRKKKKILKRFLGENWWKTLNEYDLEFIYRHKYLKGLYNYFINRNNSYALYKYNIIIPDEFTFKSMKLYKKKLYASSIFIPKEDNRK